MKITMKMDDADYATLPGWFEKGVKKLGEVGISVESDTPQHMREFLELLGMGWIKITIGPSSEGEPDSHPPDNADTPGPSGREDSGTKEGQEGRPQ